MAPKRRALPELIETGTEPEFYITDICKAEMVSKDTVRLYCCSKRGNVMRLEYTVILALADLLHTCQKCLTMAREGDTLTFGDDGETH
jgi:hypothetical protein